jgi:hypothetical protein
MTHIRETQAHEEQAELSVPFCWSTRLASMLPLLKRHLSDIHSTRIPLQSKPVFYAVVRQENTYIFYFLIV